MGKGVYKRIIFFGLIPSTVTFPSERVFLKTVKLVVTRINSLKDKVDTDFDREYVNLNHPCST